MKSKNLVSLSVAAVFAVLATTGLLIYFGQGNHTIEHTHAWFGILFFSAAVFHIVNNWSSLKSYSKDRKTGNIQRELIVPSLIVLLFVGGIALDWPVFKDLANAGKKAFGPARPERGGSGPRQGGPRQGGPRQGEGPPRAILSKVSLDSIARSVIASQTKVDVQTIQFDMTASLAENVIVAQGTAAHAKPSATPFRFMEVLTFDGKQWTVAAGQTAPVKP